MAIDQWITVQNTTSGSIKKLIYRFQVNHTLDNSIPQIKVFRTPFFHQNPGINNFGLESFVLFPVRLCPPAGWLWPILCFLQTTYFWKTDWRSLLKDIFWVGTCHLIWSDIYELKTAEERLSVHSLIIKHRTIHLRERTVSLMPCAAFQMHQADT